MIDRSLTPLKVGAFPRLFTTETFCKIVIRQKRPSAAVAEAKPA
jgi:hypothetical protein